MRITGIWPFGDSDSEVYRTGDLERVLPDRGQLSSEGFLRGIFGSALEELAWNSWAAKTSRPFPG